jgi:hypothetical protein
MAEYVRFRLNAAKVGVSVALMALIGGLAERVGVASARPNADAHFLKEASGPTGGSSSRAVLQKLDSALATLEHKLATVYFTAQKIDQTFLKIKAANTEFLKIDSASSQFLKIDDANSNFLKIDSANSQFLKIDNANANFLKIDDANNEFLKVDSIAANSSELGGMAPSAFVQGKGSVVSGFRSVTSANTVNSELPLVSSPDGAISVSVFDDTGTITLSVNNATSTDLPVVQETNGQAQTSTLTATEATSLRLSSGASESTIQIMPAGSSTNVITLTVGVDPTIGAATGVVAQMLIGQSED